MENFKKFVNKEETFKKSIKCIKKSGYENIKDLIHLSKDDKITLIILVLYRSYNLKIYFENNNIIIPEEKLKNVRKYIDKKINRKELLTIILEECLS